MSPSKSKEKLPTVAHPTAIYNETAVSYHTGKPRLVYEVDKTDSLSWTVYEHEVVGNEIVKTTLLSKDIKVLAKRKLEIKMFFSE